MRRAFIAFAIAVFLIYCWASVVYQNQVDVPDYRPVEIDLLDGRTRAAWNTDGQGRFQRLMDLEAKGYQLPANAKIKAKATDGGQGGTRTDADGNIPTDRPLTADDFAGFIANAPGDGPVKVALRDTGAFSRLLSRNYVLRDNIADPGDPDGAPLYLGGRPLDKEMLDDLRRRGLRTITISGHAAPVNFQVGTALMITVVFLALVAALKPVLWRPFMALLERRQHELEMGNEAERQNVIEATRYQEESRRRSLELGRTMQERRLQGQRDIAHEAGGIVKEAREKEKAVKSTGFREIGEAAEQARDELDKQVPELAEAIARVLVPGQGGPRWDQVVEPSPRQDDA